MNIRTFFAAAFAARKPATTRQASARNARRLARKH